MRYSNTIMFVIKNDLLLTVNFVIKNVDDVLELPYQIVKQSNLF